VAGFARHRRVLPSRETVGGAQPRPEEVPAGDGERVPRNGGEEDLHDLDEDERRGHERPEPEHVRADRPGVPDLRHRPDQRQARENEQDAGDGGPDEERSKRRLRIPHRPPPAYSS